MDRTELLKFIKDAYDRRTSLLERKGHDYASNAPDQDTLANFRRVAAILSILLRKDISPSDISLFHLVTKMDRICNLTLSGLTPACESLSDSFNDDRNYTDFWEVLLRQDYLDSRQNPIPDPHASG